MAPTAAFVSSFAPKSLSISHFTPNRSTRRAPTVPTHAPAVHMSADEKGGFFRAKFAAFALAALLVVPAYQAPALADTNVLYQSTELVAARSGGRVGGSSFRSAPRGGGGSYRGSYRSAPARSYGGYYGGGGYGGGVFAPVMPIMPFYISPFAGGLGVAVIAGIAISRVFGSVWQSAIYSDDDDNVVSNRNCAVVTVKLGLLASAVEVRDKLDKLAQVADTSTPTGLARVLNETAVALLRNKDYWICGATDIDVVRGSGETRFNEVSVRERSKIREETLSNVGGLRMNNTPKVSTPDTPEEFVVVTVLVAADSALASKIPRRIDQVSDLRSAVSALGAVSRNELQAVEIVWAPQQREDTLTRAEMLLDHPELTQV